MGWGEVKKWGWWYFSIKRAKHRLPLPPRVVRQPQGARNHARRTWSGGGGEHQTNLCAARKPASVKTGTVRKTRARVSLPQGICVIGNCARRSSVSLSLSRLERVQKSRRKMKEEEKKIQQKWTTDSKFFVFLCMRGAHWGARGGRHKAKEKGGAKIRGMPMKNGGGGDDEKTSQV